VRRGRHAGRTGFALLPVVLALALLGATAYLMTRENASGVALVASAQQTDRARYVAEAALRHATWQAHTAGCDGYSDVATTAFGADSYDATITPASGSPITVAATGTLADGTTYTFTRSGEPVYETPTSVVLQLSSPDTGKDAILDSFYAARNCGGASYLQVNPKPDWTQRVVIQFDLSSLPAGVEVISARLELKQWSVVAPGVVSVHRLTRDWVEGTKVCGGTADGASWPTFDGIDAWAVPGGDFEPAPASEAQVTTATDDQWLGWEVGGLVEGWLADPASNHGMLLQGEDVVREAEFASREASNPNDAPRLSVVYSCECGQVCGAGGGANRVLYVVKDPASLSTQETARRTLMQGWGFSVTPIDDDATQEQFDTGAAVNDAAYVSQEVLEGSLGTKLVGAAIGVVNESRDTIDVFGFATSAGAGGGLPTLKVDPSHYITSVFPTEIVAPYGVNEWYQIASTPVAAGVQPVGVWVESPWTDLPALMALDTGADLFGGGSAAGRRVQIPMGAGQGLAPVDVDGLTDDARTIIKRSIEWAAGASCGSVKPLLLVVSDAGNPTAQETARQTLLESWCYAVTRIDDDATSGEFAAAMALNDVIYISQEITTLTNVTKLRDAVIGIVNEEYLISSDLGLGSGTGTGFFNDIDVRDDTHYITSGFALGALALFSPPYDIYTGTGFTLAPDLQVLGETGSITGLAALETGGALWDSGTAAGRRVLVPWGDDFSALNSDGQTLMQRALEWAAGAGCGSVQKVLLVVGDDTLPLASKDAGRVDVIESGCFTVVSVIDDGDTQTNFDAAVDAADVVFVSGTSSGATLLDKLTGITKGLVNEVDGKIDNFGFSSSTSSTVLSDGFAQTDPLHYITEPFGGNAVTVFHTFVYSMPVPGGTLAPDLQNVAEVLATPSLVALDTGAQRWDGGSAPARRVHLPFASAETSQMTADGQTLLKRAVEWAAGASGGGGPPPPPSCDGTFRDEFNAQVWSGSDGTLAWAMDWLEWGEGGTPTGGDIMVIDDMGPYSARIRDNGTSGAGAGIRREADLSAYATATLSFDFRRDGPDNAADYVTADVSDDGGATWTELDRFVGEGNGTEDPTYQSRSYDITDFRAPNTRIRFLSSPDFGTQDVVYFDNVEICVGE